MKKPRYVHVVDNGTNRSTHCVGPTTNPDKVDDGININLDHNHYYTVISTCAHKVYEDGLCVVCVASGKTP